MFRAFYVFREENPKDLKMKKKKEVNIIFFQLEAVYDFRKYCSASLMSLLCFGWNRISLNALKNIFFLNFLFR